MTTTLLYGPNHVGKEDFVNEQIEHVYVVGADIPSWENFKWRVQDDDAPKLDSFGIIGVHLLYEMCVNHVCEEAGVEHPTLAGDKKSWIWQQIKNEFRDILYMLNIGVDHLWMTCPMDTMEMTFTFYSGNVVFPKLDWVLSDILPPILDRTIAMLPVYKTVDGRKALSRKLVCQLTPDVQAGDRTGKLPPVMNVDVEKYNEYDNPR